MDIKAQIIAYIDDQPEATRADLHLLHDLMLRWLPNGKLWFDEGINAEGKVVTNPTIGYGAYMHTFADKSKREVFQIGISANTRGISVYIMGIRNTMNLAEIFGKRLGKAKVTGYCIAFKKVEDIHLEVLQEAVHRGVELSGKSS
jgi:hypothetical protein